MQFAKVEGIVQPTTDPGLLQLVVILDDSRRSRTVREEAVPVLVDGDGKMDLDWIADQYTQETIGTVLAEDGWEAVSAGEASEPMPFGGRSLPYFVRRV